MIWIGIMSSSSCCCADIRMQHIQVYIIKNSPFPTFPPFPCFAIVGSGNCCLIQHCTQVHMGKGVSILLFPLIWIPNDPWNLKCGVSTQEKHPPPHQHCVEWIMRTFLSSGKLCWAMNITVSSGGWNQTAESLQVKAKKVDTNNCIHHLNQGYHK